jgi:hypothetical protein
VQDRALAAVAQRPLLLARVADGRQVMGADAQVAGRVEGAPGGQLLGRGQQPGRDRGAGRPSGPVTAAAMRSATTPISSGPAR